VVGSEQRILRTHCIFRTQRQALIHADAVSKGIDPSGPELVYFSVVQAGESVIGAFSEVAIPLIFGVLEEVLLVVKISRSKQLDPFLYINKGLTHIVTNEGLVKKESEEVASCNVPPKGVLARSMLWSWDVKIDNTIFMAW
jgi:hypothetical protein